MTRNTNSAIAYVLLLGFLMVAALAVFTREAAGSNYGGVSSDMIRNVRAEVKRQFPRSEWRWAWCVINRESGWNPRASSHTNDHGLWQINGIHAGTFGTSLWGSRYTIRGNTRMAFLLWRGQGHDPWRGGGYAC